MESLSKLEQVANATDGRDVLDMMFEKLYPNSLLKISAPCRCTRPEMDGCNSILSDVIKTKMESKALPLALRKRMLYEQARAS